MKKLLSIVIACSMLCTSAPAAPVAVSSVESASEIVPEYTPDLQDSSSLSETPSIALTFVPQSASEAASDAKPINAITDGAVLMSAQYSGGDGSEQAPFEISSAADLINFSANINSGINVSSYYKLTTDIDLGGEEWIPAGFFSSSTDYDSAFKGSFDGDGHTVSNFKITTASTNYIGFFGLVYNGEVKNLKLDNVTVDLAIEPVASNEIQQFIGTLAGRVVGYGIGGVSSVTNCHATNSTVKASVEKDAYAGGLVGFVIAGQGAKVDIFDISADCEIDLSLNATGFKGYNGFEKVPFHAYGAALLGYFGALTDTSVTMRKASAAGSVNVSSIESPCSAVFAGGLIAQSATRVTGQKGGTARVSICKSTADVTAASQLCVYAGGFAGSVAATENYIISDCYTSGNISAGSKGTLWYEYYDVNADPPRVPVHGYSAIGGFIGQLDFENYTDSMGKPVYNCYSSCNVAYTKQEAPNHEESYDGGFAGFSFAPLFEKCYILEDSSIKGIDMFEDDGILLVASQASKTSGGYPGFDFDSTWKVDGSAEYPYPVFREISSIATFYSEGEYFGETYIGEDGKASMPKAIPQKKANVQYVYTFSHWSLTEDGDAFDFESTAVDGDTAFYAVFSSQKQVYNVSLVANGKPLSKVLEAAYGEHIPLPEVIPTKPETSKFYYEFLYWSLSENGEELDFDSYILKGNVTLYAVFREINKSAWKGEIADSFSSGYGTQSLPYIIANAEEFALLAKVINEGDSDYTSAYYTLGNDIHLGYNEWYPIGTESNPFSAKLDGNGYSVSCFIPQEGKYMGLFGCISNGTVENLIVSDFEIILDGYTTSENIYAGGLAGYITSLGRDFSTTIDSVYVKPESFSINAAAPEIYAGAITGYANTEIAGTTLITNSYASADISVTNTALSSHSYAGGLFGYMYTYSMALSKAAECYFTGSVTAYSDGNCYAAGIAGLVNSYGSFYLPPVSSDSSLDAEVADYDVMLENCFAAANISSSVSEGAEIEKAYAGAVAADIFMYARAKNVYYQRNKTIYSSTNNVYVAENSTSAAEASLISADFLSNNVGFDFENVWTFIDSEKYPVLKVMYAEKPILRIESLSFEDGILNASVLSFSPDRSYTVVFAVYNERNQLIASRRETYKGSKAANSLPISLDGLRQPYKVKVSAIDTASFIPLFTAVERFI